MLFERSVEGIVKSLSKITVKLNKVVERELARAEAKNSIVNELQDEISAHNAEASRCFCCF